MTISASAYTFRLRSGTTDALVTGLSPKPQSIGPKILVCNLLMRRGKSVDPWLGCLDGCGKLCITSPYDLLGAPNWADGRDELDRGGTRRRDNLMGGCGQGP